MGRPPKYDWEDKRDICYKLFVEQKLTGSQIIKYFSDHFGVSASDLPGINQFYTRFRRWGFPSRKPRLTEDQEAAVIDRVRELFNQNYIADDALRILQDEGYDIDRYRFRKLRMRHGMTLRGAPGFRKSVDPSSTSKKRNAPEGDRDDEHNEVVEGADNVAEGDVVEVIAREANERLADNDAEDEDLPPLPQEEVTRRAQRLVDMQIESDQRLQTRKRRRRIRGWGHMPADDPGLEPRYGSETSLDECKAYLQLDNTEYTAVRDRYAEICREMGIIKMTLCTGNQWQESKDRLVRENPHLSAMLHPLQPNLEKRLNALNCICSDVTKRMRNSDRFMTIPTANNTLGLDPSASKEVRRIFYDILKADRFTSIILTGKERVDELRQRWYAQIPVLAQAIAEGDPEKIKAITVLDRDTRKRYRDEQSRIDPTIKQWQKRHHYGPGPGPAAGRGRKTRFKSTDQEDPKSSSNPDSSGAAFSLAATNSALRAQATAANVAAMNFDLDPLLASAVNASAWPQVDAIDAQHTAVQASATTPAITAYFRLASGSTLTQHVCPAMWLGRLSEPTLAALHNAATSKASGARVSRVHGVAKNPLGSEDAWLIDDEDELHVYLAEAGEKPTFSVTLTDMPTD